MSPQLQVRFGLAADESAGAAVWADPHAGVAAVAFGGACASYAEVLFSRLARLADAPAVGAGDAYPPRVIKAASILETLHRELWQVREQGHQHMSLGVGVLVRHQGRLYLLQIGPVQLLQIAGDAIAEVAGVARTAPLLGLELKSGIGVFTLELAPGRTAVARVIEASEAAPSPTLAEYVASAAIGDADATANAVLAAASSTRAVVAITVSQPVTPSQHAEPSLSLGASPVREEPAARPQAPPPPEAPAEPPPPWTAPAQQARPAPSPPEQAPLSPEAPRAPAPAEARRPAASSEEGWNFEDDVVGELSSYMSALQNDPDAPRAAEPPRQAMGRQQAPGTAPETPSARVVTPASHTEATPGGGGADAGADADADADAEDPLLQDASSAALRVPENDDREPAIVPPALGAGTDHDYTDDDAAAFLDGVDEGPVLESALASLQSGRTDPEMDADFPPPSEHSGGPGEAWVEEGVAAIDAVASGAAAGEGTAVDAPADAPTSDAWTEQEWSEGGSEHASSDGESAPPDTVPSTATPPSGLEAAPQDGVLVGAGAGAADREDDDDLSPRNGRREGTSYGKAILTLVIVAVIAAFVILRPDRMLRTRVEGNDPAPGRTEATDAAPARTAVAEREVPVADEAPMVGPVDGAAGAAGDAAAVGSGDAPGASEPTAGEVSTPRPAAGDDAAPAGAPEGGAAGDQRSERAPAAPAAGDEAGAATDRDGATAREARPATPPAEAGGEAEGAGDGAAIPEATAPVGGTLDALPELYVVTITGPEGGAITIDGERLVRATPAEEIVLDAGVHAITVDYGPLGTWRRDVDVTREAMRIDATPRGTLRIDASGAGGEVDVALDGRSLGTAPPEHVEVVAGSHRLAFTGAGLAEADISVFVTCGDTALVTVPVPGAGEALVVVGSRVFDEDHFEESEGDSIWIDRSFVGLTPREITVTPGTHGVRVRSNRGEAQITRIVELPAGAIRVVRADFGGERRLTIRHRPLPTATWGLPLRLSALVADAEVPRAETMTCHLRVDRDAFRELPLERDTEGTGWVLSLAGKATEGRRLEYYFSARDTDGVEIVSEIYRVPLDDAPEVAENS